MFTYDQRERKILIPSKNSETNEIMQGNEEGRLKHAYVDSVLERRASDLRWTARFWSRCERTIALRTAVPGDADK